MIKRLLGIFLILALTITPVYGADLFMEGDGSDVIAGTDSPADIDTLLASSLTNPLDRLLDGYISGATITVTDDEVLTISAGQVVCQDSGGVHRFRENTGTTTVTNTTAGNGGLDTGSVAASTWYFIYADADADATTFTAIMSLNASAPTANCTYYKLIGAALTDGSSDWLAYFWIGTGKTITIMWDVPTSMTTTVKATWFTLDCSAAIPSISTLGIFGLASAQSESSCGIAIRPNGSTWTADNAAGIHAYHTVGGQRECMTDSSQNIEYYNNASDTATTIMVEGFIFQR